MSPKQVAGAAAPATNSQQPLLEDNAEVATDANIFNAVTAVVTNDELVSAFTIAADAGANQVASNSTQASRHKEATGAEQVTARDAIDPASPKIRMTAAITVTPPDDDDAAGSDRSSAIFAHRGMFQRDQTPSSSHSEQNQKIDARAVATGDQNTAANRLRENDSIEERLIAMGFKQELVSRALIAANGLENLAVQYLIEGNPEQVTRRQQKDEKISKEDLSASRGLGNNTSATARKQLPRLDSTQSISGTTAVSSSSSTIASQQNSKESNAGEANTTPVDSLVSYGSAQPPPAFRNTPFYPRFEVMVSGPDPFRNPDYPSHDPRYPPLPVEKPAKRRREEIDDDEEPPKKKKQQQQQQKKKKPAPRPDRDRYKGLTRKEHDARRERFHEESHGGRYRLLAMPSIQALVEPPTESAGTEDEAGKDKSKDRPKKVAE